MLVTSSKKTSSKVNFKSMLIPEICTCIVSVYKYIYFHRKVVHITGIFLEKMAIFKMSVVKIVGLGAKKYFK